MAERLAAAWQRPAEPEPRDEVAALEPARRVTLPEPQAEFANARAADRRFDLNFIPGGVWAAHLTEDGRTFYVGYRPVNQPRPKPGPRRTAYRLRAIDVETGATRWDVETPEPKHVGGSLGASGNVWPALEPLADGDLLLWQSVVTQPPPPRRMRGLVPDFDLESRRPRVDVYRLDRRDGSITQTTRGEPGEMLRLRRLVPPEAGAPSGVLVLRYRLPRAPLWLYGRLAYEHQWRLERWRGSDLAAEVLLSESRVFFDSEPYVADMPQLRNFRISADGNHLEGVTRVTRRSPALRSSRVGNDRPYSLIQRYALPDGRPVASTYQLPVSKAWRLDGPAYPPRLIFERRSSPPRGLRVLTLGGEGAGRADGAADHDDWVCSLAVDEGHWHNHGLGFRFRGGQLRGEPSGSAVRWYTGYTATSALWLLRLDLATGHTELRGIAAEHRDDRLHFDALRDGSRVVVLRLPPEVPGFPAADGGRQGVKPDEATQLLVYDFPPVDPDAAAPGGPSERPGSR